MAIPLLGLLTPIVGKILDKIPNAGEREKARLEFELKIAEQEAELAKALLESDTAQVELNKVDAASNDKFRTYWRPAVAWVCVAAYAWSYLGQPIITFGLRLVGVAVPEMPSFDLGEMTPVLMGLLGLAGLRSWEKKGGVK